MRTAAAGAGVVGPGAVGPSSSPSAGGAPSPP